MTKEETFAKLNEQENKIIELQEELTNRPEKVVVQVNEMVIENSSIGGDVGALAEALSKCQGEFTSVKKGASGHGYNYADLQSVLESAYPITSKHGISIIQLNVSKMLGNTPLVGVKTVICHTNGGYMSGEVYMPTVKTKMNSLVQMAGVNITYLRRYGIQSALGLSTTDNDGRDD
jgi:regulator of replication initiation timing